MRIVRLAWLGLWFVNGTILEDIEDLEHEIDELNTLLFEGAEDV